VDRGRIGHAIEGFDVDRGEIDFSCTCVYPNPEMQDVQGVGHRWISSTADKIFAEFGTFLLVAPQPKEIWTNGDRGEIQRIN
jgi:hypothetical protein